MSVSPASMESALLDALESLDEDTTFIESLAMFAGDDELCVDRVRAIGESDWLTDAQGVELSLSDGSVWLVTVQRAR